MAQDALGVVVLTKEGGHVTRSAFDTVVKSLTDDYIRKVQAGSWLPEIEAQRYSSEFAVIAAADAKTQDYLLTEITKLGFKSTTWVEYRKAKDTAVLFSGLLTGMTAQLRREKLTLLLESECKRLGIGGTLVLHDTFPTNTGRVLRLRADEEAAEGLKRVQYTLRFALAGKVLFTEVQAGSKTKKIDHRQTKELERLRERTRELEEQLAKDMAALKQLEDARNVESRMASLEMKTPDTPAPMEEDVSVEKAPPKVSDAEAEKLLAEDEQ